MAEREHRGRRWLAACAIAAAAWLTFVAPTAAQTAAPPATGARGARVQPPSLRTSGRISRCSASRVIGPMCLWRITPSLSTTKVSGTP